MSDSSAYDMFTGRPEDLQAWQAVHQAIGYIRGRMADGATADDTRTHQALGNLLPGLLKAGEVLNRDDDRHLYRLDLKVEEGSSGALPAYLALADSPAAAAHLVVERAQQRWPKASVRVQRVWEYPPGELVLAGAHELELVGGWVADVG